MIVYRKRKKEEKMEGKEYLIDWKRITLSQVFIDRLIGSHILQQSREAWIEGRSFRKMQNAAAMEEACQL